MSGNGFVLDISVKCYVGWTLNLLNFESVSQSVIYTNITNAALPNKHEKSLVESIQCKQ